MAAFYGALPALSLFLSSSYQCRPKPYVWQPDPRVFIAAWTALAITTGWVGTKVYILNDQEATTIFVALCWLFGTGWMLSNRLCNQYFNFAYGLLTLFTAIWLQNRLKTLDDNTQNAGALSAKNLLWPLIGWLIFACVLWGYALIAKIMAKPVI